MQKIIPHLWFDKEAKEAAEFYVKAFGNGSRIKSAKVLKDTPSGDCDIMSFELCGFSIMSISAGPAFKLNPAISFMVNFDPSQDPQAREHLDALWSALSDGGEALMPLDTYPFSERYGWIKDKFGLTWQLILTNPAGEPRPFIIPSMLFVNESYGKAEAALDFYLSVFKDARKGSVTRYPAGMEPNKEGTLMFGDFQLENQWFAAMDGGGKHDFAFNEAFSFLVKCEDQAEIDYYWEKLSAVPEAEQCGWLKDKFGVSWQITPVAMDEMMNSGDQAKIDRVTKEFLQMKKFDLAKLLEAAEGK